MRRPPIFRPTSLRPLLAPLLFAGLALAGLAALPAGADERPAKQVFGKIARPSATAPAAIGFYSKGCLAGAESMPVDGPAWQAMRLSRNRTWGHPRLIAMLKRLAVQAQTQDGWPGLLVGDLSQPRGGPMLTGHASHQVGLDADVWLTPMPSHRMSEREREDLSATPLVEPGPHVVRKGVWTPAHFRVIRRAALQPEVERIFVAPGIKKKLCEEASPSERGWLAKVRPYYGHNYHMHLRIGCPAGSAGCKPQREAGTGDGCGADLAYWYTDAPYAKPKGPPKKPAKKPRPVTLADLPASCTGVVHAAEQAHALMPMEAFRSGRGAKGSAEAATTLPSQPAAYLDVGPGGAVAPAAAPIASDDPIGALAAPD